MNSCHQIVSPSQLLFWHCSVKNWKSSPKRNVDFACGHTEAEQTRLNHTIHRDQSNAGFLSSWTCTWLHSKPRTVSLHWRQQPHCSNLPWIRVHKFYLNALKFLLSCVLDIFRDGVRNDFLQFTQMCHIQQKCCSLYCMSKVLLVKLKTLHPEYFLSDHL
jgi:hypothetical protein